MSQQRQTKGSETGGQFAASANPESTVMLAPEKQAEPRKGKQVYFAVFFDDVTKTWHEDPEYMRDGQQVYDNARNNGNWEPVGAHDDLFGEAWISLKANLIKTEPNPSEFDVEIAEHEQAILDTQKEYEETYVDADYDDLIDLKKGIIDHHEAITRLQRMKIDALHAQLEQLRANESSFDLEAAVAERVIDATALDASFTGEKIDETEALVREYFKDDPTNVFENGLGQILDREADEFMRRQRGALDEILGGEKP
jgi:hypothetical protein